MFIPCNPIGTAFPGHVVKSLHRSESPVIHIGVIIFGCGLPWHNTCSFYCMLLFFSIFSLDLYNKKNDCHLLAIAMLETSSSTIFCPPSKLIFSLVLREFATAVMVTSLPQ